MITFAAAVFFLIITPGPGVLSAAGVGAAYGMRSGLNYVTGLFIGNNLVILAVISGLAAVVLAVPWVRIVLFALSTAYLLYIALRIAFAGSSIRFITVQSKPGVLAGILLQPINPKAYAVHITLFSGFAFYLNDFFIEIAIKLLIANVIWILIHLLWLYLGVKTNQLELPKKTQGIINVFMAICLLAVVGLSVWSIIG